MDEAHPTPPIASFHTPEELLETARELLCSGNPRYYRGAALEALAALEAFVHKTVFPALAGRFPESICRFLEEKTKMDFDSRLIVLAPLATGVPVEQTSQLWKTFKEIRNLRKGVVHGSKKVTRADVERIIANTTDWINYLGQTIELEKSLMHLKRWVEEQPAPIVRTSKDAERIIADFFSRSKAADVDLDKPILADGTHQRADAILKFGARRVIVEAKFARFRNNLNNIRADAIYQVDRYRKNSGIDQACVIIFLQATLPASTPAIEKHADGKILSVNIHAAQP